MKIFAARDVNDIDLSSAGNNNPLVWDTAAGKLKLRNNVQIDNGKITANDFTTGASSIVTLGLNVYQTGQNALASGGLSLLYFNTVYWNSIGSGVFDGQTAFTAKQNGWHLASCVIEVPGVTGRLGVFIRLNGNVYILSNSTYAGAALTQSVSVTGLVYMAAGNYIQFQAYSGAAGTLYTRNASDVNQHMCSAWFAQL